MEQTGILSISVATQTDGSISWSITFEEPSATPRPLFTIANNALVGTNPQVSVSTTTAASTPLGGTWSLTFNSQTLSDLSPNMTSDELALTLLEGFSDAMAGLTVQSTGNGLDSNTYVLTFAGIAGPVPLVSVDASQVTGTNVQSSVTELVHGSLDSLAVINGEFMETASSSPSIRVTVNGILSSCQQSSACSFSFDPSFVLFMSA